MATRGREIFQDLMIYDLKLIMPLGQSLPNIKERKLRFLDIAAGGLRRVPFYSGGMIGI